jgi:hypothetical protein
VGLDLKSISRRRVSAASRPERPAPPASDFGVTPTTEQVPQPIPAGGATFHHQRTHYAGPNATGYDRRACATEFQLPPADAAEVANRPWITDGLDAWNRRAVYTKPKQS